MLGRLDERGPIMSNRMRITITPSMWTNHFCDTKVSCTWCSKNCRKSWKSRMHFGVSCPQKQSSLDWIPESLRPSFVLTEPETSSPESNEGSMQYLSLRRALRNRWHTTEQPNSFSLLLDTSFSSDIHFEVTHRQLMKDAAYQVQYINKYFTGLIVQ